MSSRKAVGTGSPPPSEGPDAEPLPEPAADPPPERPTTQKFAALKDLERIQLGELERLTERE